ncbi:hypothetical protein GMST_31600 [Geomonas silvestris]|uniref:Uncharacterized protein n=1 Tax=Geomonas silvestris TaxID=2740184 RepID=A0A6V8MLC6_9BACT|nr:hypothetical protein [Geomonas silvestris]GFO60835.1 hypothetical protein GMST_31600 [Geomonas silvestris]
MAENETPDQEPEFASDTLHLTPSKGRRAFVNVRRELSDEELSSPALQRVLIDDIERLEKEKFELTEYMEKYHEADKKAAVLEEKVKKSLSQDLIFGVSLTLGAAALGYAPAVWSAQPTGWITICFGLILIGGGIASRVVKQ